MAQRNRESLKNIFRGNITDRSYSDLIESTINIKDDGIDKDEDNGLKLTLKGSSRKLMSFYEKIGDKSPAWSFSVNLENQPEGFDISEKGKHSRLFIKEGGNVGIGTTNPLYKLDVNGLAAMRGRVGTYSSGYVPADGNWHSVLENIDGCQAFEAFAHINDEKENRFGLTHAILLISKGVKGSKMEVNTIKAGSKWPWGKLWNHIQFRWAKDLPHSNNDETRFSLQIRTRTHYGLMDGRNKQVFYRLAKLWDKNYEKLIYKETDTIVTEQIPMPKAVTVSSTQSVTPVHKKMGGIRIKKK